MALIIDIKVVPSSGKHTCMFDKTGQLKCYLKNPPEQNRANQELIKLLATALKIPQTHIQIVLGVTGRKKRIRIEGDFSLEYLYEALGIVRQTTCV